MFGTEDRSRILVVEDEDDIRQVLYLFLKHSGFEVCGVSNAQEAIRIIPEFVPHLIVLDLLMRPVDGWEVLHWLQASPQTPPIPVLVLTALVQLADLVHGFEEGAIEYMTKPTQPSKLVERIREILALSAEERIAFWRARMEGWRRILERVSTPPTDEFVY